jgi:hypothetical protein
MVKHDHYEFFFISFFYFLGTLGTVFALGAMEPRSSLLFALVSSFFWPAYVAYKAVAG